MAFSSLQTDVHTDDALSCPEKSCSYGERRVNIKALATHTRTEIPATKKGSPSPKPKHVESNPLSLLFVRGG